MINSKRLTESFVSLTAIDSPTFSERAMADELTRRLVELGLTVTEDDAAAAIGGNTGNILATLPGTIPGPPLLFAAHMDTVQPCEGKKALVGEDGTITSEGDTILGADDLCGVAEILEALRSIQEENKPHRDIEVLFTVAEEYFLKGSEHFDITRCRAREGYILDVDGPVGTAVVGAPTGIRFIANVQGKSAHAAIAPEEGINAVTIAARAIAGIRQGRIDQDTTACISIIRGGTQGNIVPDSCFVEGEVRSLDPGKADYQVSHMQRCFIQAAGYAGGSVDFQLTRVYEAYRVPEEAPVVQSFMTACRQCGIEPSLTCSTGGSDNSMLSAKGFQGIILACGMHDIHGTSEHTSVGELTAMAQLVEKLMTAESREEA